MGIGRKKIGSGVESKIGSGVESKDGGREEEKWNLEG